MGPRWRAFQTRAPDLVSIFYPHVGARLETRAPFSAILSLI